MVIVRVGGSGTLKAIIGRAREPRAEAEIELMRLIAPQSFAKVELS